MKTKVLFKDLKETRAPDLPSKPICHTSLRFRSPPTAYVLAAPLAIVRPRRERRWTGGWECPFRIVSRILSAPASSFCMSMKPPARRLAAPTGRCWKAFGSQKCRQVGPVWGGSQASARVRLRAVDRAGYHASG